MAPLEEKEGTLGKIPKYLEVSLKISAVRTCTRVLRSIGNIHQTVLRENFQIAFFPPLLL